MTEVIRLSAFEKRFPGVHALRASQFDLKAGEVQALMGEIGAGEGFGWHLCSRQRQI